MTDRTGISTSPRLLRQVIAAGDRATRSLFDRQNPEGYWIDRLPSAAISTAASVVALHFADPNGSRKLIEDGLRWLRENQLAEGGWGDGPQEPATLPATAVAVASLMLLDPERSASDARRGLDWIEAHGGLTAVADPDQCALNLLCLQYLALAGLYDENRIRPMSASVGLLPRRLRRKVSFVVPVILSWTIMQRRTGRLGLLSTTLARLAEPRSYQYFDELTALEPLNGGSEESPLLVSLVCMALARVGQRPDLTQRAVRYLHSCVRPDGSWSVNRDLAFSVTSFVSTGIAELGLADDPHIAETARWIKSTQWTRGFPPTGCPPGGWAWSPESGWPNSDDTANGLTALARFGYGSEDPQVAAGVRWLLKMQNSNGSWSCFCRNNHVALDAPCSVITAHALTALRLAAGLSVSDTPVAKALRWFTRTQRPDGSMDCLWYRNSTAGTARVLDVLGQFGMEQTSTAANCRRWLLQHQNPDGGWGDGRGAPSSAEETAWAMTGLLSVGTDTGHVAVDRAASWLIEHQRDDGLWDPTLLGVYFLDLRYSDDLLATGYAMQALGHYMTAKSSRKTGISTEEDK